MVSNTVTKYDAASIQLASAIDLYFQEKNLIPVHTLAAAANGILCDIADHRNLTIFNLLQRIVSLFPPTEHSAIWNELKKPQNFFKHADRDQENAITLNNNQTELLIFSTVILADILNCYSDLYSRYLSLIYNIWFHKTSELIGENNIDRAMWDTLMEVISQYFPSIIVLRYECSKKEFMLFSNKLFDLISERLSDKALLSKIIEYLHWIAEQPDVKEQINKIREKLAENEN